MLMNLSRYDEFFCHEFNLFLFIKDKPFFNKVAKPMIAAKLRKDMMDYFFLNDVKNLNQYKQENLFTKLNSLEQILLSFALKEDDKLKTKTLNYFSKQQELLKVSAQKLDKLLSNYYIIIHIYLSLPFFFCKTYDFQ